MAYVALTVEFAMVEAALTAGVLAVAAPALLGWSYLAFLTLAAFGGRPSGDARAGGQPRLTVLVPAHDEATLIARCVSSIARQSYPAAQIIVIADNCNDATAAVALDAGARVMIRDDQSRPGKGRALRWAMDAVLAEPDPPDGIVVIDADSVVDPGLLAGLAQAFASGADAAQADYTVLPDVRAGRGDHLRALAVLLFNRTRNRGRAAAGLPATLLGNGMMLSRELLQANPWSAFSAVEDLEFGTQCRVRGIRPRFVWDQGVRGPLPVGYHAGISQRLRWEGGRFHVLRLLAPALVARLARHPDLATMDALLDLVVPPLWILVLVTAVGFLMSLVATLLNVVSVAAPAVWAACALLALIHVLLGLRAADAPRGSYRALLALPGFFAWKVAVYLRFLHGFDPNRWQRSLRNGEVEWR